jgi:hypothetical protein
MNPEQQWNSSDALLLQCVFQKSPADPLTSIDDLIAISDYIDHSIFNWEEFDTSLKKLLSVNYLELHNNKLGISANFKNDYLSIGKAPKSIQKEFQQISKTLANKTIPDSQPANPFSKKDFDLAVKNYSVN